EEEEEEEEEKDDDDDYDDEDEDKDGAKGGGIRRLISIGGGIRRLISIGGGKRRLIFIGGGAAAALILIGGGAWFFLGGDEDASKTPSRAETGVPHVEITIPPRRRGGMLTPPGDKRAAVGSLNAIAAADKGPGAGVMIPAVTMVAFANIPEVKSETPLTRVPDLALVEQSPQGPLPKVGEDGRKSWQVYARPFEARDARPRIAVIITGLGLSGAATEAAIRRLPGVVTLAFDPYAQGLDDWVFLARQAGHEVLLSLPMESAYFPVVDAGPYALKSSLNPEENLRQMEFVLSRMSGYVGVATAMGSKFTADEQALKPVLEAVKNRGLMLIDSATTPHTKAARMATEIGLPRAVSNLVLDENPSKAAIDGKLAELEAIVRERATAVAVASANPATLERIAVWAASLADKNLALVPVSAVADKQFLE
ncbi:MAG: divergent polysaccharide deacetylase family protein, partial [Rhodospirillales bacterium]